VLQQTAAAILVPRDITALSAAAAAERVVGRRGPMGGTHILTRRDVLAITTVAGFGTVLGRALADEPKGSERPPDSAERPQKFQLPPKIELEEAVRLAKVYVKGKRIDTAGKYLASAELASNLGGFSWRVTWMPVACSLRAAFAALILGQTDGGLDGRGRGRDTALSLRPHSIRLFLDSSVVFAVCGLVLLCLGASVVNNAGNGQRIQINPRLDRRTSYRSEVTR